MRILSVGLGINLGCLGVGFSADLLDLPISRSLNLVQVTFFLPGNSGCFAFAFRAKSGGDLLAFANHSLVNAIEHVRIVIDALEPDIEQIDAELGQLPSRLGFDFFLDFLSTELDWRKHADRSQAGLDTFEIFVL